MENLKFKLKQGKKIMLHGMSDVLTNGNLTNEKAIAVLRRIPAAIKFFEVFPADWRTMISAKPVKHAKELHVKEVVKETVEEEPQSTDKIDLNAIRRDNLQSKNITELRNLADNLEIPVSQYKNLKKPELVELLFEATK